MGQDPKKYKPSTPKTDEEIDQSVQAALIYTDQVSQEAHSFLLQVLTYDPKIRLTALQALSHPYFYSITGIDDTNRAVAKPTKLPLTSSRSLERTQQQKPALASDSNVSNRPQMS